MGVELKYNELKFEQLIGTGAYAEVYKAKWRNCTVAVKRLSLTNKEIRPQVCILFDSAPFDGGMTHLPLFSMPRF